jgi:hypothetical protein
LQTSRGLAVGDIDNDGDPDLLIATSESPARLLLDTIGQRVPWLGLRLVTGPGPRDAYGATVWLRRRGAPTLLRHVHPDGSYASSSDPRLLFGLGEGSTIEAVDVRWPAGTRERFVPPPINRYTTLRQGSGRPVPDGKKL